MIALAMVALLVAAFMVIPPMGEKMFSLLGIETDYADFMTVSLTVSLLGFFLISLVEDLKDKK